MDMEIPDFESVMTRFAVGAGMLPGMRRVGGHGEEELAF